MTSTMFLLLTMPIGSTRISDQSSIAWHETKCTLYTDAFARERTEEHLPKVQSALARVSAGVV